ncbi:anoctamin-8 isoform X3 [Octopus bimaculoides]|uniref:Anoctamin n=1 Tax=Octopus bimaculoides TaxID=37653 RepID=A0A0L8G0Z5_OCTBM|nr:anoctamin-8 isoform X3 [Octopus bimaculoides]XP_052821775.1 anoctamin-8 isoform X3 [Octopus bimaculoides]|eukprot:XP_014785149.1 PREDICTED: anoctamin-8-like isoform X1 [Octopus bimaculoides]
MSITSLWNMGKRKMYKFQRSRSYLQNAYRVFGKRLLRTSQFVVSSRIWLHTIPTRNCDVLMTFPPKTEDAKLMWVLKQLKEKAPQIIVHVRHHAKTEVFGFYMTASYQSLLKGAENLCIRKSLKQDYGGGMKEFTFEEQDLFENIHNEMEFFTSQERQSIVYGMLNNVRSTGHEHIHDIVFREGQAIIPTLVTNNVISNVFPLHNNDDLIRLRNGWVNAFCKTQPLNQICEYFGVKIAMYFAYLGHYTTALCIPALIGLLVWTMEGYEQESRNLRLQSTDRPMTFDDWCFVGFALFNVLWATLYLEHWKRRSAELAYKWGTLDKNDEVVIDPRPFYKGELEVSSVTGRLEPFYPIWKRNMFRYFVTLPVVILCLCIVFAVMLANFYIEELITKLVNTGEYAFIAKVFPKVCHAASIFTLDRMYTRVAYWLNDMENYRMQEAYENHLIIKLVLFQFVNSFLSLFYIAFYLQDMELLREQLMALLIMRQIIGNVKEALLPYLMWHFRMIKAGLITTVESPEKECGELPLNTETKKPYNFEASAEEEEHLTPEMTNTNETADQRENSEEKTAGNNPENEDEKSFIGDLSDNRDCMELPPRKASAVNSPSQAEVESTMSEYEDTFEDYLEMFIQFGYVTLFSSAFPLAAICALLNNVIEIRSDAFKLCMTCQRPFGQQVENIGTWADALMLMGILAVIVNCALIGVFGHMTRIVPGLGSTSYLFLIIVLEHIILGVKMWIAYAIPDIPQWVATEMSRLDFLRREAFKKLDSHQPHNVVHTSKPENPVRSQSLPPTSNQNPHQPPHSSVSTSANTMSVGDTAYITRPSTFQESFSSQLRHRQTPSVSAGTS